MRRLLCIFLAFAFLFVSACELEDPSLDEAGAPPAQEQSAQPQLTDTVFGIAYTEEDRMNPLTTKNKINLELYSLIYEGLFELNERFEPVNVLCSSYEMNGTTYKFNIKDGVTFSDGSALRAKDVVASLRLAMQPESYYAPRLTNISNIRAEGNSVLITVNRYTGNLPRLLDVPIIKSGSDNAKIAVGTGSYVLKQDDHGGYQLIARDGWHVGKKLPYSRIEITKVSGVDELIFGFESRDIDVVTVDSTGSDPIQFRGEYESREYPTTIMQYMGFNMNRSHLVNPLMRQAIACAIDREGAVEQDYARLADAALLPVHPNSAAYNADICKKLEFSLQNAASLFAAAGWTDTDGDGKLENERGGELSFKLLVNSENKSRVALANRISGSLAKIGVTVAVDERNWDDYIRALQSGSFDTYLAEVNLSADFDISHLIRTGGALNYGRYSSTDTDTLLDAFNAATLRKSDEAAQFYQNFVLQVPIAPILFKKNTHITHRGAFESLAFTQRNVFYHFYDWKPVIH